MVKYIKFLYILIFIFLSGCSWMPFVSAPEKDIQISKYLNEVRIINTERLKDGGTLLVLPFRPGSDVMVDESFDKVVLMLTRGFIDVYEDEGDSFRDTNIDLIFSEKHYKADFTVDGFIIKKEKPSFFKKWFLFKRDIHLVIKGRIQDEQRRTVATFRDKRSVSGKKGNHKQLARLIGQNIAKFILELEYNGKNNK